MSQENVEIVRTGIRLINSGDWDAAWAMWHPDLEFQDRGHPPDMPEVLRGRDAVRRMTGEWKEIYSDLRVEVLDYIDADPWVVCDALWYGRAVELEPIAGSPTQARTFELC